jgi:hypothetical protein
LLAAYASAALICVGALLAGQAVLSLCGRREWTSLAGPVGLGVLLAAGGVAAGLDGRGVAIAVTLGAVVAASGAVVVARGGVAGLRGAAPTALAIAVLAALLASLPFIAAGRVGILGVGLVNDDMASHLLLASWIDEHFSPEPGLVGQGYPQGPHALAAGLAAVPGIDLVQGFAGLTVAVPALTALVVVGALGELRAAYRVAVAALVALPYLGTAYLAQGAFKEPILALALLGFAMLLGAVNRARDAIPLGVIAAGVIYVYSFPGLVWLAGAAVIWALIGRRSPRALLAPLGAAVAALLVLTALDFDRLTDFTNFRALDPDRANEGGLGNLHGHLSPLEALGIWPTSEFRLPAGAGSLPAAGFYAGALFGAAALALGLPRWMRRHGRAIPAALAAALLIYVGARAFGTVYTSAKALAIATPLVMLIALGGLAAERARGLRLIALVVAAGAALSSFLVLRQAPVGPEAHARELAELRPLVAGERVLFLGRDNFVLHELRGSKPFVHVRNFYDPYYVEPNPRLRDTGLKFDFDSVAARTLDRFRYVITTRAAYASGHPPAFVVVRETESYALWKRLGSAGGRRTAAEGREPGAILRCVPRRRGLAAVVSPPPVRSGPGADAALRLTPGRWDLSIQYDATRPLRVQAPGLDATLPANLDFRGPGPFWPVGTLTVKDAGPVKITTTAERPPLAGRLIGAKSLAHVGAIAATPVTGARPVLLNRACGEYVDWYVRASRLPPLRQLAR